MIFSSLALTLVDISFPIFLRSFFNVLSGAAVRSNAVIQALVEIIFILLAIHSVGWVLRRVGAFTYDYVVPHVMSDLEQDAYDYLQRHSYGFFTNRFVGSLVRKITRLPRSFE